MLRFKQLLYQPWILLPLIVLANLLAWQVPVRLDLTSEKKYSLSPATRSLLKQIEAPVTVEVFLTGEFPAVFRKLQNSTNDLLTEMKAYAGTNINIRYTDATSFLSAEVQQQLFDRFTDSLRMMGINADSLRANPAFAADIKQKIVADSLRVLGINPYNLQVQQKENETAQRVIFPAALVRTDKQVIPVDLLSGKPEYSRDPLNGRLEFDEARTITNAEALLEFKFADAVAKLQRKNKPAIGYMIGNGQPMGPETYDLVQLLEPDYAFSILDPNKSPIIPKELAAILVVKPAQPFSDSVKMKLDQYVMQGGKVLWFLDMLHAEKDSLAITAKTLAYDRNLNLDDLLFRYGVRINRDLLQQLPPACDMTKMVVGTAGGQPQLADVPFNYYPLLNTVASHPATKNLEPVLAQFTNTIDTVKATGIRKQVLLQSTENAKTISTPAIVSLEELRTVENPVLYNRQFLPVGVLLEGSFTSLYANRASDAMRSYFTNAYGSFRTNAPADAKQFVVADGDLLLNPYTQQEPFPMGYSRTQEHAYGNRALLQNLLEYMTGNADIISLRNKDVVLRLLNPQKLENERLRWQLVNTIVPLFLLVLGGWLFHWWRKRKYGKS